MSESNSPSSLPTITARLSVEEKARFAAIARRAEVSEAALARVAIRSYLELPGNSVRASTIESHVAATDRITIRLRPGDGLAIIRRANERDMKPATYVAALVRAHVTANPPLPTAELNALKTSIAVLAGLGTVLAQLSRRGVPPGPQAETLLEGLRRAREEILSIEKRTHDLAKAALIAWETRRD